MLSRPPLKLAAAGVAAFWFAAMDIAWMAQQWRTIPWRSDFPLYYLAARTGVQLGWSHIYDLRLEPLGLGYFPLLEPFGLHYLTPPPAAWLVIPFSRLPLVPAYWAWFAFLAAAFGVAWWLEAPGTGFERAVLLAVAVGLYPFAYGLAIGQVSILAAAAVLGAAWLLRRERDGWAGILLACGLSLKPNLLLLAPVALLGAGRGRAFLACAGTLAALAVASVLSLGAAGSSDYLGLLKLEGERPFNAFLSLTYLHQIPIHVPMWALTGLRLLVVAAALLVAWRSRKAPEPPLAAAVVGSVLAAPYIHTQDFVLLIAAAWLLLRSEAPIWVRGFPLLGLLPLELLWVWGPGPLLVFESAWLGLLAGWTWRTRSGPKRGDASAGYNSLQFGSRDRSQGAADRGAQGARE